jgi:ferredoxin
MKRKIIQIDANQCNGCGLCIPNCPEGAIQMIDGKARLISDLFCDGLGACLGHCPEGAITIEEREAEPYDERRVMENIIQAGPNTIQAHLVHLQEHNEQEYLKTALAVLEQKGISVTPLQQMHAGGHGGGCPGSAHVQVRRPQNSSSEPAGEIPSELTQWPIQLHLISPSAASFQGADMVLAADCAAYSLGDFHRKFLKGKALAIACPKLDEGQDVYAAKITALIDQARINTLTVVIMEVPCCGGLVRLAQRSAMAASRKIPIKTVVLSRTGEVLQEEWA